MRQGFHKPLYILHQVTTKTRSKGIETLLSFAISNLSIRVTTKTRSKGIETEAYRAIEIAGGAKLQQRPDLRGLRPSPHKTFAPHSSYNKDPI